MSRWVASRVNGVGDWEIMEYKFFDDGSFTYETIVRGIDGDQACYIAKRHNKALDIEPTTPYEREKLSGAIELYVPF